MKAKHSAIFKLSLAISLQLSAIAGLSPAMLAQGIPANWGESKAYQPPVGLGTPGRREPAGTRGGCPESPKQLTALVPVNSYGVTLATHPTFLFYLPKTTLNQVVEFSLVDDTDSNDVYKASFQTTGNPGVISITIPASAGLPALEINKDYHWVFSLICNPSDRAGDIFVEGRIRRVTANNQLNTQLKQAQLKDKIGIYAKAEIWYDALTTIAELRRNNPQDSALLTEWEKLLKSVKLDGIANEPLINE